MSSTQKADLASKLASLSPEKRKLFEALAKKQAQKKAAEKNTSNAIPTLSKLSDAQLSFSQEQALTAQSQDASQVSQNLIHLLKIDGEVSVPQLESAFLQIIKRHQILRTGYQWHKDGFKPLELDPRTWYVEHELVSENASFDDLTDIKQQANAWFATPFDLANELPVRVKLYRFNDSQLVMAINIHHIAADGRSMAIILQEFAAFYQQKGVEALPALEVQYQDVAHWTRRQTQQDDDMAFWKERLQGVSSLHSFHTDKPRPSVLPSTGKLLSLTLPESLTTQIKTLSKQLHVSEYNLLLAIFSLFVQLRSTEKDVVIGSPVSTRLQPGTEHLIGYFVNVLPLRLQLSSGHSVSSWVEYCQTQLREAMSNAHTPVTHMVSELKLPRTTSHAPLVQIMFSYLDEDFRLPKFDSFEMELLPGEINSTDMEFALNVVRQVSGLTCYFEYNSALFSDGLMAEMMAQWSVFLNKCLTHPTQPLSDIVLSSHKIQFPQSWENSEKRPPDTHFVSRLKCIVSQYSDNVLAEDTTQIITYQQAWQDAISIATYLQNKGIEPGDKLGLHCRQTPDVIAAVWGVWLVGAAFVPINIDHPDAFKSQVFSEAKLKLLLGNVAITETVFSDFISIETILEKCRTSAFSPFQPVDIRCDDIAAIYFTSGSTGKPKGVVCHHGGYYATMSDLGALLKVTSQDRILQFSSFGFDVFLEEMLLSWLHGAATVWTLDNNQIGIQELVTVIGDWGVTLMESPTALWHQWMDAMTKGMVSVPKSLRTMLVGGEPVDISICQQWPHEKCALYNVYGCTEVSISNIVADLSDTENLSMAPIGKPLACSQAYILDDALLPVLPGQKGEMYLAGESVGLGYINNEEQQQLRFIPDPIKQDGSLVFRTGDVASYDERGNLYCYGRKAFQVRLNGYSIEVAHIEAVLRRCEKVGNAVVLLIEESTSQRYLVAFIEAASSELAYIKSQLTKALPQYMLPHRYRVFDIMPVNSNGKIDRKQLRQLWLRQEHDKPVASKVLPEDEFTQQLVALWQKCLPTQNELSLDSNFFACGGSSIDLIKLSMLLQETFNVSAPVAKLLEKQTLEQQQQWLLQEFQLKTQMGVAAPIAAKNVLKRADLNTSLPLSNEQSSLWFAQKLRGDVNLYRILADFEIRGRLNKSALQTALEHVLDSNPVYRVVIEEQDGQVFQRVTEKGPELECIQVANEAEAKDWISQYRKVNNCSDMLHLVLLSVSDSQHFMVFNIHHIVTDEWSVSLLNAQLLESYQRVVKGEPLAAEADRYHYLDYVVNQSVVYKEPETGDQETSQTALTAWQTSLQDLQEITRLSGDLQTVNKSNYTGRSVVRQVHGTLFEDLKDFASRRNITMNTLMQSVFGYLMRIYWRDSLVNYAYSASARQEAQWQDVQGYFVQTHWCQFAIDYDMCFADICDQAQKHFALQAQTHGLSISQAIAQLPEKHVLRELTEVPVMFNYQRQDRSLEELPEVGLKLIFERAEELVAKFDLTVNLIEQDKALDIHIDYRTALYSESLISHFADAFCFLTEQLIAAPHLPLKDIPLVNKDTWQQLVVAENQITQKQIQNPAPAFNSLVDMFEYCVRQKPEAIAIQEITPCTLSAPETALTVNYAQLNQRANQNARWLESQDVQPGDVVIISLVPGAELVTQVLAAHKLGATVVTADHKMPAERLQAILQQAQPKIIVKSPEVNTDGFDDKAVLIDELINARPAMCNVNMGRDIDNRSAAYMVFTSGSTGKPKAIINHHEGLVNIVDYQSELFNIEPGDKVLQYASVNFEGAIADIYMPLIRNACCCLLTEGERTDMDYVNRLIQVHGVNIITMTPSAIPALQVETLNTVKSLLAAGEVLPVETANYAIAHTNVFNLYGPSECSLCTTIESYHQPLSKVELGTRVRNMAFYIVNEAQMLLPKGAIGEICISGVGVTHGYHQNEALTAARFLTNPFATSDKHNILYRSGDMARSTDNGMLQFVGRDDDQIKIRGQRVEIKEIESVLRQSEFISDAFVLVKQNETAGDYLVAFYTLSQGQNTCPTDSSFEKIASWLRQRLPEYMMPARIVPIAHVPYTPNGKLDKGALFAMDEENSLNKQSQTELDGMQQRVWWVWSKVLGLEAQGDSKITPNIDINFFELGGNSLHLTRMVADINKEFDVSVSISEFLQHLTLAQQAQWLTELTAGEDIEELEW